MRKSPALHVCCLSILSVVCNAQDWDAQDGLVTDSWVTTTASDYRGNWYAKKEILRQARSVIESVEQLLPQLKLNTDQIVRDCQALEQEISQVWDSFGFSYADGVAQVQKLVEDYQTVTQQSTGSSVQEQKEREQKLIEHHESFESLLIALNALNDISVSLADVKEIVRKQAEKCTSYDQKAWDNYERISQVLNDVLAARLYQEMVSFLDNIEATQNYFSQDLNRFVQSSRASLQEYEQQASEYISVLRQEGLLEKLIKPEDSAAADKAPVEKHQKPVSAQPWYLEWFSWLWSVLVQPFKIFGQWIKNIF